MFGKLREFQEKRKDKKIQKCAKLVANGKAIKDERRAAIAFLSELDNIEVATPILLSRFDYSLEHGINDTREKELAMEGIVKYGESVVPYLEQHLKQTTRIAWPIKILDKVGNKEVIAKTLMAVLDTSVGNFDQAAVDKNYDVLCHLRDFKLSGFTDKLLSFLDNPDERVRFAAAEALIGQDDPVIPKSLEPFLADETSENRRIRQVVVDAFLKNSWKLEKPDAFESGLVVEGVFVTKTGQLENRGGRAEYH